MSLIYFLLIGLLAGWLAGVYMGKDFTLVGNLIIGVVGAMIGGFLFQCLGFRGKCRERQPAGMRLWRIYP